MTSGFYGGQTGGNGRSLKGSKDEGTDPKAFSRALYGTSFSAPLVAGGASLMASAAGIVPSLSGNPDATQSVVIKAAPAQRRDQDHRLGQWAANGDGR